MNVKEKNSVPESLYVALVSLSFVDPVSRWKKAPDFSMELLIKKNGEKVRERRCRLGENICLDDITDYNKDHEITLVVKSSVTVGNKELTDVHRFCLCEENGWGTVKDCAPGIPVDHVMRDKKDICALYKDIKGEKGSLFLSFRIEKKGTGKVDLSYFRRAGYWPVDNFCARDKVGKDLFCRTFSCRMGRWYDLLLHPINSFWYYFIVVPFISGTGGQCYGMTAEALRALHGESLFSLPLDRYELSLKKNKHASIKTPDDVQKVFADTIREKHLFQGGWKYAIAVLNKAAAGNVLIPVNAFEDIKRTIDQETYCVVNLAGKTEHTVLGYGYDRDRIYVADCNHPWWESDPYQDSSYICLTEGRIPKVELSHYIAATKKRTGKTYSFVYTVPYEAACSAPRVPYFPELLWEAAGCILKVPVFLVRNLYGFLKMFFR